MKSNDFKIYTSTEITEMWDTWKNFIGFTGEICGSPTCKKKVNVLAGGSGWFCECGQYNVQSLYNQCSPHEQPDLGTPASVMREGVANSNKWKNWMKS